MECLERRLALSNFPLPTVSFQAEGEAGPMLLHNAQNPSDVDASGSIEPRDALLVINALNGKPESHDIEGEAADQVFYLDVNADVLLSPLDALTVINRLNAEGETHTPTDCSTLSATATPVIVAAEADCLLQRAAAASASEDAIMAVVDRGGRILGVRVEEGVIDALDDPGNPVTLGNGNGIIDAGTAEEETLVFAIDGAVAKARTAAFFSSGAAPLTSRTIRFISQSTVTQREVEANPNILDLDSTVRGPGFVAPIGVGGHFPPEIPFTPPVDLFAIEHQSRDSRLHPGLDGLKGTADDIVLANRFNVADMHIPAGKAMVFPESYGVVSERLATATARGIATLPGGIPLYKDSDGDLRVDTLVGGIGVFFPGSDGFATHEQDFRPGVGQSEKARLNAPKVLESEWIAYAAAGGASGSPCETPVTGDLGGIPAVPGYALPCGRIDLVGITLEIFGPHPTRESPIRGAQRLAQVGRDVGPGAVTGTTEFVAPGVEFRDGVVTPDGWLVEPHDSSLDENGDGAPDLSKADVERIIRQGIDSANQVRAAIRLTPDGRPGERTRMVFAVADKSGEVLGLFRMEDATIFSIDVSVAKARNTAYHADADAVLDADLVDDNRDGVPDIDEAGASDRCCPRGTAFTNRTFRFLAEPRFPTGGEDTPGGAFSILRDPMRTGIDPHTAENLGLPMPASVFATAEATVLGFDAFNPSRNFRDPDDLANQNGIVFFPGSSPLYSDEILIGGFGVSGDGVDQDDVVTVAGQQGYAAPAEIRVDQFKVVRSSGAVRLPFQKFLRNPLG